jgi:heme/copper-type cytochrome/quinol oxidase subunit 2
MLILLGESVSLMESAPEKNHIITAKQQMRAAQGFTFFSCLAVLLLPLAIPLFIWVAASIFMYAAAANHPNPKVCEYITQSGYRFYSTFALLVVMAFFGFMIGEKIGVLNVLFLVWGISVLMVVPLGVRDMLRAAKEDWQDMKMEIEA